MEDKYFFEVKVENFIDRIQLSKKQRPTYFKKKDKIPKKYSTEQFAFVNNSLINIVTGEKVIKNSIKVGTPNIKLITGQYFWEGAHPHIRRKIKKEMSEYFYKYLKDAPQVKDDQYPIGVRIDLYDDMNSGQD